jgi:hypothetical protein
MVDQESRRFEIFVQCAFVQDAGWFMTPLAERQRHHSLTPYPLHESE